MDNDLIISTLKRVKPDQGKAQWVEGKITGIAKDEAVRTHTVGIPHLMPATIIFVHGVNSEGEWYRDAAAQFSKGLNERLAREDLKPLALEEHDKHRFRRINEKSERVRSPIIPFYWGYSANRRSPDGKYLDKRCMRGRDNTWQDNYGNSLRQDGTWGGGPFQNGTTNLLSFWQSGYRRHILNGIIDTALLNPIIGRELQDCPDRQYYVHAARRLANLVMTIRQDFPNEHINIVAHSQGTMIALCALFYMDAQAPAANGTKLRGPDTVLLNNSPYRFDTRITDYLMAAQGVHDVQTEAARLQTFVNAARIVQNAVEGFPHAPAPDAECTHQPAARQAYDGCAYIHQPPSNPD